MKKWYASKTIWAAIVTGIIGVLLAFGIEVPPWVITALAGLGVYGRATASKDIN